MTLEKEANFWLAYTDGASRGNPGQSGAGVLLVSPEEKEYKYKLYLGEVTNNQAEYQALILALQELVKHQAQKVLVRADSELMIKQLLGVYKVKNERIKPLYAKVQDLLKFLPQVQFEHVRREYNKIADRLANEAIDEMS